MSGFTSSVRSRLYVLVLAAATAGMLTSCSHPPSTTSTSTRTATVLGPVEQVWWRSTRASPPPVGPTRRVTVELPGDVLFNTDSHVLTTGATTQLDVVLRRYLAPDRDATAEVVGHTNPDGGPPVRALTLSRDRARSIAVWFERHGIAAQRIATRGQGDREPKYPTDTAEHRAGNRRCELIIRTRAS